MNIRFLSLLLALGFPVMLIAQSIGIGQWRTHLPYTNTTHINLVGSKVYTATPYDLFVYDTEDNSLQKLDKVQGLNDVGISTMNYNPFNECLMVAYTNANIDLIFPDEIINISDIKNEQILGNKSINRILFSENLAYLSCGFGIVVLDLNRLEVFDTYIIGENGGFLEVYDLLINDTAIVASTEDGLYFARTDSPNLADFNEWNQFPNTPESANNQFNAIEFFDNKIIANLAGSDNIFESDDILYSFDGNAWVSFGDTLSARFEMRVVREKLYISGVGTVRVYNSDLSLTENLYSIGDFFMIARACEPDASGNYWIADQNQGLIRTAGNFTTPDLIFPNGPVSPKVFDMDAGGDQTWVASGGWSSNWGNINNRDGAFRFDGVAWRNFNSQTVEAMDTIIDMVAVAVDPGNPGIAFVGSWNRGILAFENDELVEVYNTENSSIQPWVANPNFIRVSGLAFDQSGNLWVANSGATNLFSRKDPSGNWQSYFLGSGASGIDIGELMIDQNQYKWVSRRNNGTVLVFNDNNTWDDPTDDQVKTLSSTSGNGGIVGARMYSMATDQDGEVWVGTDDGISVFYNPGDIFTAGVNFDAQRILVPRNDGSGQADVLLEAELISAIVVDGVNNKWIGTDRSGVFYLSEDGLEEIHHFTVNNSPLLSNRVIDIAIDANGEVFIGTDLGVISYRSEATPGNPVNLDVFAYPNPVRENYDGPIAITGLVKNADVKITDSNGNVVFATTAQGGQAVWDGRNFDGNRAKTGIYLVFITNQDGSQTEVTKIMIIR